MTLCPPPEKRKSVYYNFIHAKLEAACIETRGPFFIPEIECWIGSIRLHIPIDKDGTITTFTNLAETVYATDWFGYRVAPRGFGTLHKAFYGADEISYKMISKPFTSIDDDRLIGNLDFYVKQTISRLKLVDRAARRPIVGKTYYLGLGPPLPTKNVKILWVGQELDVNPIVIVKGATSHDRGIYIIQLVDWPHYEAEVVDVVKRKRKPKEAKVIDAVKQKRKPKK